MPIGTTWRESSVIFGTYRASKTHKNVGRRAGGCVHLDSDSSAIRSNLNLSGSKMQKVEGTVWMLKTTATGNMALEVGIRILSTHWCFNVPFLWTRPFF